MNSGIATASDTTGQSEIAREMVVAAKGWAAPNLTSYGTMTSVLLDPIRLASDLGWNVIDQQILSQRPGRVVARVQTSVGPVTIKADSAGDSFAPEVTAINRLSALGLPTPRILGHEAGPPDVLVLEWIGGEPLCSSSPSLAQREVGYVLRTLHAISAGPPFSGESNICDWIAGWTNSLASWWSSIDATNHLVPALHDWQRSLMPLLAKRAGALTLFDGRTDHFLVRDGHLVGMIDLHDVGAGDPAMDLAVLVLNDPSLLDGVLEGYGPSDSERSELEELIPFYVSLRHLAAAEWNISQGLQVLDMAFIRQLEREMNDHLPGRRR